MSINVVVIAQYNDRSFPDNLLLTQAPMVLFKERSGTIIVLNISVQYNGGLLPDIILLT